MDTGNVKQLIDEGKDKYLVTKENNENFYPVQRVNRERAVHPSRHANVRERVLRVLHTFRHTRSNE